MKGRSVFPTINTKIADRILGELRDGAAEGRALKAVRTYRGASTDETREAALAAINALPFERIHRRGSRLHDHRWLPRRRRQRAEPRASHHQHGKSGLTPGDPELPLSVASTYNPSAVKHVGRYPVGGHVPSGGPAVGTGVGGQWYVCRRSCGQLLEGVHQ